MRLEIRRAEGSDRPWVVDIMTDATPGFLSLRECKSLEEACAFIAYLNGGEAKPFFWHWGQIS